MLSPPSSSVPSSPTGNVSFSSQLPPQQHPVHETQDDNFLTKRRRRGSRTQPQAQTQAQMTYPQVMASPTHAALSLSMAEMTIANASAPTTPAQANQQARARMPASFTFHLDGGSPQQQMQQQQAFDVCDVYMNGQPTHDAFAPVAAFPLYHQHQQQIQVHNMYKPTIPAVTLPTRATLSARKSAHAARIEEEHPEDVAQEMDASHYVKHEEDVHDKTMPFQIHLDPAESNSYTQHPQQHSNSATQALAQTAALAPTLRRPSIRRPSTNKSMLDDASWSSLMEMSTHDMGELGDVLDGDYTFDRSRNGSIMFGGGGMSLMPDARSRQGSLMLGGRHILLQGDSNNPITGTDTTFNPFLSGDVTSIPSSWNSTGSNPLLSGSPSHQVSALAGSL